MLHVEPTEDGPEVAVVVFAFAFARDRPRLTGEGGAPGVELGGPSGFGHRDVPHSDACEEVTAGEAFEVFGFDGFDRAGIHFPFHDVTSVHEVAQPLSYVRLEVVEVRARRHVHDTEGLHFFATFERFTVAPIFSLKTL